MSRASRFLIRSVARLVWAKSVRGLTVLLLGGVLVTLLVRAVEGQGTRDPVSQPVPPVVASGDSSGAPSLGGSQVAAAQGQRRGDAPVYDAAYLIRIPESSMTYSEIDAARMSWYPVAVPGPGDDVCDWSVGARLVKEWLALPRRWARVPLPDEVEKVLGDPDVYIVSGGGDVREMWALRAGRHYYLPSQLTQLAVDAGYEFTRINVPQVLRVWSFFAAASERLSHEVVEGIPSIYGDPTGGLDSLLRGEVPLVKSFALSLLGTRFADDKEPDYRLEIPDYKPGGIALAVMDWGTERDSVTLSLTGTVGFEEADLPYVWLKRRPDMWMLHFEMPVRAPQKRGEIEGIGFEVDLAASTGVRRPVNW